MFPFGGLVLILVLNRANLKHPAEKVPIENTGADFQWMLPTILCFAFYLLPYMGISYYERYGVPVTLPRILFIFWLLYQVKLYFMSRRKNSARKANKELVDA